MRGKLRILMLIKIPYCSLENSDFLRRYPRKNRNLVKTNLFIVEVFWNNLKTNDTSPLALFKVYKMELADSLYGVQLFWNVNVFLMARKTMMYTSRLYFSRRIKRCMTQFDLISYSSRTTQFNFLVHGARK